MLTYSQAKECIKDLDRSGLEDLIERMGEGVVEAGLSCGISPGDIEESYAGQFASDKDFAMETADQLGLIKPDNAWPYTCIDWEWAAQELMHDYCEENGYYFRNL